MVSTWWGWSRHIYLGIGGYNGLGAWIINRTREAYLNILNNKALRVDNETLLKEHGIYYARRECNHLSSMRPKSDNKYVGDDAPAKH